MAFFIKNFSPEAKKSKKVALETGVEPVTYRLEGGCSIQLSYPSVRLFPTKKSIDSKEFSI